MITVQEHQKSLSAKGIHLSEQETSKLLDLQYKLANILFDLWVKQTKPDVVVGSVMVVHKENGNCVFGSYTFVYAYA